MIEDPTYIDLFYTNEVLRIVIIFMAILAAIALVFATYTLVYRLLSLRREDKEDSLTSYWKPVLLEVLSGDVPPSRLWRRVSPKDHFTFLSFLLQYALVLSKGERKLLIEIAEPFLGSMLKVLKDRDPTQRALAVQTLGILGQEAYGKAISEMLDDPAPLVGMTAMEVLAQESGAEYAPQIVKILHRFDNWGVNQLASMLTRMGGGAAPALREALADEAQPSRVRVMAAEALRWLNDPGAAAPAQAVLSRSEDDEVLAAAMRLLRRVGRPEHAQWIRPYCTSHNYVVRLHALSALSSLSGDEEAERLMMAMEDPSRWVAIRAARGLREVGEKDLLEEISETPHFRAYLAKQVLMEGGG